MSKSSNEERAKLLRASRVAPRDTVIMPAADAASVSSRVRQGQMRRVIWASIICVLAAVLGLWAYQRFFVTAVKDNMYQAVSLTNGQIYFGKLAAGPHGYIALEHPYVTQTVQAADSADKAAPTTTLVKVRDQVYGPDDVMYIRADQVTFWQNLRSDSKVMSAIKSKQGN